MKNSIKGGADFPPTIIELEKRSVLSTVQMEVYTSLLVGKMLTVIDASISDVKQNKATKDLVKSLVWNTCDELRAWCLEKAEGINGRPFPFLSGTPKDMLV